MASAIKSAIVMKGEMHCKVLRKGLLCIKMHLLCILNQNKQGEFAFNLGKGRANAKKLEFTEFLIRMSAILTQGNFMKKTRLIAPLLGLFLLAGCSSTKPDGSRNDPMEGFNRTMFNFNYKVVDPYVLEPAAKAWTKIPKPISTGLSNMANNLDEPVSFVNRLIEGEPRKAFVHFNRFWINSVFGLGGFIDFASSSKELQIDGERTFGETLGAYGVDPGAYIVLPIYNATTPRELTGAVVDTAYMYPFWKWVGGGAWSLVKTGVQAVDTRAQTLDQTELLRQAQDPYVTFREAYYQNLQFKVNDGKESAPAKSEALSQDILNEID